MTAFGNYEGNEWQLTKEQKEFFEKMEEELRVPITVISARGQRQTRDDGVEGLVFYDYSTNAETPTPRRIDAISRKNGTTIALKNGHLLKPDDREHIWDFNGFPLCEIRLNTLWSLIPLQNFDTKELMMEFWADAMRQSRNEDFFREMEDARVRKIREAFINTMKSSNEAELKSLENDITKKLKEIQSLDQQLVAHQTQLYRAQQRRQVAEGILAGDETSYEEEISSLLNHCQIKAIDFNTGTGVLEVYTVPLYLYSPDKSERSLLGAFCIKIHTKEDNRVSLHNLTNQRSHKMHPHVEENGAACWGAISGQISLLAATGKIEGLADMCIRYLEGYNPADGYAQYARYWFTEKDTEKQREEFDGEWMTAAVYREAKKSLKEKVTAAGEKDVVKEEKKPVTDKTLEETKH